MNSDRVQVQQINFIQHVSVSLEEQRAEAVVELLGTVRDHWQKVVEVHVDRRETFAFSFEEAQPSIFQFIDYKSIETHELFSRNLCEDVNQGLKDVRRL